MNKKILFCVTGMSPAVVTETLYALTQHKCFIPDEIHVITTSQGKNTLMRDLLGIEGGRKISQGAFHQFCQEYNLTNIVFNESHIHLITNEEGEPLSDIQTPEQNILAADAIVNMISQFCLNPECEALHVSIAGGRKTMGFFAGYALSLYGRKQDRLSHVLVEAKYEMVQNFFYPTKMDQLLIDHKGSEINAKNANVMLAEIPWVRLGLGLPTTLLSSKISYSESIRRAQVSIASPTLKFINDFQHDQHIECNGELVHLSPKAYVFLFLIAIYHKRNCIFDFSKWEKIKKDYLYIYGLKFGSKKKDNLNERITDREDLKSVISESRNEIKKSLNRVFGIVENDHFCLPQVKRKGYSYTLYLDPKNIFFSNEDMRILNTIEI